MLRFLKMQFLAAFSGLVFAFFALTPSFAMENDSFKMLRGDVYHNMESAPITNCLQFEFNHRLDFCDNEFTLTGGKVSVKNWEIKGTFLTIVLSENLEYDTEYTLYLKGLSDIYFEEYQRPEISFKTTQFETLNYGFKDEKLNSVITVTNSGTYFAADFINHSEKRDVYIAMMLFETDSRIAKKILFKKISLPKGNCSIFEGFENIGEDAENLSVKVFVTDSPLSLNPVFIPDLKPQTISGKSEK